MHDAGYKSALARRVCRYSDARPPRKTDGVLLESELPPHMRGKGVAGGIPLVVAGITPTYAGKRSGRSGPIAYSQDHPRVCGEKLWASEPRVYGPGSPPRMRGKVAGGVFLPCRPGITPAYAGKSRDRNGHGSPHQDHPRVCGEKMTTASWTARQTGSPPRMRGKGMRYCPPRPRWWDHPRVCGEKYCSLPGEAGQSGSPPRMRGKVLLTARWSRSMGITPAYAGKSCGLLSTAWRSLDHPRVCGEKDAPDLLELSLQGSPPRMRGKD